MSRESHETLLDCSLLLLLRLKPGIIDTILSPISTYLKSVGALLLFNLPYFSHYCSMQGLNHLKGFTCYPKSATYPSLNPPQLGSFVRA